VLRPAAVTRTLVDEYTPDLHGAGRDEYLDLAVTVDVADKHVVRTAGAIVINDDLPPCAAGATGRFITGYLRAPAVSGVGSGDDLKLSVAVDIGHRHADMEPPFVNYALVPGRRPVPQERAGASGDDFILPVAVHVHDRERREALLIGDLRGRPIDDGQFPANFLCHGSSPPSHEIRTPGSGHARFVALMHPCRTTCSQAAPG
jgi:hypothetical protein